MTTRSDRRARKRAAAAVVASGWFDREWYSAQTGVEYADDVAAATDYLASGAASYSPHPGIDLLVLPERARTALARGDITPLTRRGAPTPRPRLRQALLAHQAARRAIDTAPAPTLDWTHVRREVDGRVPGRVSVVVPTYQDGLMTSRAVRAVLAGSGEADLEVVVVDNGSDPAVGSHLVAQFFDEPRVRYERMPVNLNFALGSDVGFARSTGDVVVFLNNDTQVRDGWLPPLLDALRDESVLGVQPLLLYPDDTVQSAGTVFPAAGTIPCHFLVGHPPEDAERLGPQPFRVVTAAALAMRAGDVAALEGFDPVFVNGMEDVDLCLRAAELRPGHFLVTPASRVTHHEGKTPGRGKHIPQNRHVFMERWRDRLPAAEPERWTAAGFRLAGVYGDGGSIPSPRPVVVRDRPAPPLRWGLKLPSPGGEKGDRWGDTHFADSLGAALTALGQEVVTYRRGAHGGPPSAYDDVVLGLRGLEAIAPVPGKVNLLWVISHPDDVDPAELAGFDRVFAASPSWAGAMSARARRPIDVLLQATDLRRQADLSLPVGDGSEPVFVGGTTATRDRQVVLDAMLAGLPLKVHGPQWAGKIPAEHHASTYVPNHELADLYRHHGLVLADHHSDMATRGFLANRLFDAVAAGARVISDPVPGLEIFQGAVQAYASVEELADLWRGPGRSRFPDEAGMARIAAEIAEQHSFDHRAAELLAAAEAALSG